MPLEDFLAQIFGLGGTPPPPSAAGAPQNQAGNPPAAAATPAAPQSTASPSPAAPQQGGVEKFLSNPLVQGALDSYLGTVTSPRKEGWGMGLARGGLTGLQGFNQAEQLKQSMPLMQAQTAEAQARVPLMQSTAESQRLSTAQQRREQAPVSPEMLSKLDAYKAASTNPQERTYFDVLEGQAQAGVISSKDLDTFMEKYDESKRLMELYKGQAAAAQAQYMPYLMNQFFPGMVSPGAPGVSPGMVPPPPVSPPATGMTPPPGMKVSIPSGWTPGPISDGGITIPGFGKVPAQKAKDGKSYFFDGTAWQPIPTAP